ncbi:hypothetical protein Cgig2_031829 [Carnegiea gigantea]|uniref:Phosphatidic acid phosphatase type 2/haloperoxidase domain-containing protein n=1 Tax=Carnegiea gigantea TaxID=171969 RepID=A0A9Q1KS82_9CARY|nr:hypothetical protein Cgig2_031829 [Carnegiea gigantea]
METIPAWQSAVLAGIVAWIVMSSILDITRKIRSLLQPWVTHHVVSGIPFILQIQKSQHKVLDVVFSVMSCAVSVPFYTAFLPLLFWDVVSAPRPSCPPVRRLTATKDEEENAQEYGLPSSHTLNTTCLSGYFLYYILSNNPSSSISEALIGFAIVSLIVGLIGFGRIYLGMHSLIDVVGGLLLGFVVLALWLTVHEYIDSFITTGQNVTTFWAALSLLLLSAYPTPEFPTPSFEFHTAFTGVAFGIVAGMQQTYHQFHHENVPRIFTSELTIPIFWGRVLVGIPTILLVKYCSKALAKWFLPVVLNTMGVPIRSTVYLPALNSSSAGKKAENPKQPSGYFQKFFVSAREDCFDVDTGIRFLQYAGLAWSVVDLVPTLFSLLKL